MSLQPDNAFRSCPSCGSPLSRGAITCSYCGGVIAVESVLGRLRAEARNQIERLGQHLRNRDLLVWVLALCPIVVLAPVLAILMNLRSLRTAASGIGTPPARFDALVLVAAVCNIVLSVMFWRWLSEISMSSGISIGWFLKSLGVPTPRSPLQSI
jgi:hypothetical protein